MAAVVAVALSGCVSMWEGDRISADLSKLRERVKTLEKRDADTEEQLTRLRKVLDDATTLLARNSADVGARVQTNEAQLQAAQGQIEEAKHLLDQIQKKASDEQTRLNSLEASQAKIVNKVAPTMADDKDALWKQASDLTVAGNREEARRFFRGFIQRFPQDPRTPQAYLEVGKGFSTDGKHTNAAAEFQKVLDAFPKSAEVPEAMWYLGQAFLDLKFCRESKAILDDLGKRFPKNPRASAVKARSREIGKILRDKDRCQS